MIKTFVIKNIKHLLYKFRYPQCSIGKIVNISSDSSLGDNTEVANNSRITSSSIGKNVKVKYKCVINNTELSDNITIQSNCHITRSTLGTNIVIYNDNILDDVTIGRFSYLAEDSKVNMTSFGHFCSIGPFLICGYGEHPTNFVSTSPVFFSTSNQCGKTFTNQNLFEERKQIEIGHDVWIGARVFIRDGMKIGNGAIIATGSVVVKDVPDYALVGGVPAKIIRYRFSTEIISKLLDIQWWNWPEETLQEAQPYFAQNDMEAFISWADSNINLTTTV